MSNQHIADETYTVTLDCGHPWHCRVAPPKTGELVYCRNCGDYKPVRYRSSDWRASCVDCKYSRYLGADNGWAMRKASDHVRKNPSHRVKVFRANNPTHWDLVKADQPPLPIPAVSDVDIPY